MTKSPIAVRETPASLSQKDKVPKTSSNGRPLENPMQKIARMRGSQ